MSQKHLAIGKCFWEIVIQRITNGLFVARFEYSSSDATAKLTVNFVRA